MARGNTPHDSGDFGDVAERMMLKGEGEPPADAVKLTGREITSTTLETRGKSREVRFGVTYTIEGDKLSVYHLEKIAKDAHRLLDESIEREVGELMAEVTPVPNTPLEMRKWPGPGAEAPVTKPPLGEVIVEARGSIAPPEGAAIICGYGCWGGTINAKCPVHGAGGETR